MAHLLCTTCCRSQINRGVPRRRVLSLRRKGPDLPAPNRRRAVCDLDAFGLSYARKVLHLKCHSRMPGEPVLVSHQKVPIQRGERAGVFTDPHVWSKAA